MLGRTNTTDPARRLRTPLAIAATAAALATVALFPASGLATNKIEVGVNGTSIVVNGTTFSTSNLTLAQLAKLQGVPPATVKLELDGVALNTPAAPAVEALVAGLPLEATLASVLEGISSATGGAVSPQTALRQVIGDEGQPGAAGANGANGSGGAPGSGGAGAGAGPGAASGAGVGKAGAKMRFTLRAAKGSLKGRPGSRVRVRFNVSSAAKLSYSGRKLARGSRKVKSGANVLSFMLPRRHGNYKLVLQAVSTPDGQRAQTTIVLHDATARKGH
jgi:hypothetical protein